MSGRRTLTKVTDTAFHRGILAALVVVHAAGDDALYDDIVNMTRAERLYAIAKRDGDLRFSGMAAYRKRQSARAEYARRIAEGA